MSGRWSAVLLAISCLALGFLLGRQLDPPAAPDGGGPSYLASLTDDLQLRPDQVAEIGRLLAQEDRDLQALTEERRAELAEPIAARLDRTVDAMLALLDAEQRARYHELVGEKTSAR